MSTMTFVGPKRERDPDPDPDPDDGGEPFDARAAQLLTRTKALEHRPSYPFLPVDLDYCAEVKALADECRRDAETCTGGARATIEATYDAHVRECRLTRTFDGRRIARDGSPALAVAAIGSRLYRGIVGLDELASGASVGGPYSEKYMTPLATYAYYYPYSAALSGKIQPSTFCAVVCYATRALAAIGVFTGDSDDTHFALETQKRMVANAVRNREKDRLWRRFRNPLSTALSFVPDTMFDSLEDAANAAKVATKRLAAKTLPAAGLHTASAALSARMVKEVRWMPDEGASWDELARTIEAVQFFKVENLTLKNELAAPTVYYEQKFEIGGTENLDIFLWRATDPPRGRETLAVFPDEVAVVMRALDRAHGKAAAP